MKIEAVNRKDLVNVSELDLDINKLKDCTEYTKVCYLLNYKFGVTKFEKNFYTFYVKDVNANVVTARLFNLEDFTNSGFNAMLMKSKPVKIYFLAQIYNGSWSLIVKSIEYYDGDFDYKKYIGLAEYNDAPVREVYKKVFGKEMPSTYNTNYFPEICGGRVGGFISLLEKSFTRLYAYQFGSLDTRNLHKCFFICMDAYYNYLTMKLTAEIIPTDKILKLINSISYTYGDYECLKEVIDTIMCLLGLAKPQHIYSHLICDTVKQTNDHFNLIYLNQSIPLGSTTDVYGRTLIKY